MKLLVGLGNPGREYQGTRHNMGYMVLAELYAKYGGQTKPKQRFHGELMEIQVAGEMVLLLSPTTFMNRSGLSVQEAVRFYKTALTELLVICDDLNLPFGQFRLRTGGSSGGQKGLQDIIQKLASEEFCRARIGIGRPVSDVDVSDYVLSRFKPEERKKLPDLIVDAASAVECWVKNGPQETMNRFNSRS
ncbi:MAG: aminoacyl-tRNA hydrolase [Planctomycetaceae bacterium]|jgi:PTH1 family peptidyl-tRNA hydrolase|nr:aminoacyl-tRNA hydrolase [Planctomycetaceae bacterium]